MEDQNSESGFWLNGIRVPDAEGKCPMRAFEFTGRIKVSLGKPKLDYTTWKMYFKTVLPVYVQDKLKGQSITRNRGGLVDDVRTVTYKEDMNRTVSASTLDGLVKAYTEIVDDFVFLIKNEKEEKQKFIFIRWDSDFRDAAISHYNGAQMGRSMKMNYSYFVGYATTADIIYDINHKSFNTIIEKDILTYTRIPWTQEREDFFDKVYDNFSMFKDHINQFFANLNANTIDSSIQQFKMLN